MKIELISVKDSDFEFSAKKDALGPHINSRWGWNDDYQRNVHTQRWSEKPWFLIILNNEKIGTVLKQSARATYTTLWAEFQQH